jgi:hypothetical protein
VGIRDPASALAGAWNLADAKNPDDGSLANSRDNEDPETA